MRVAARLIDLEEAHRPHRDAWRSSPSRSASWKPPTRPSTTSPTTSTPANPPRCWRSSPASRSRKRSSRSASSSARCSTSAIRPWCTRTSPCRCRSWSMPASRSSSCRRPPRCAMPNVTQKIVDTLRRYAKTIYLTQTVEKKDGKLNRFLNLEDAFKAWENEPRPARMAHAFPRAGVPRRSRRIRHHALRHRGRAEIPQGEAAVAPARDRDLHLGRAAGSSEDRRHRRLRLARDRMGRAGSLQ